LSTGKPGKNLKRRVRVQRRKSKNALASKYEIDLVKEGDEMVEKLEKAITLASEENSKSRSLRAKMKRRNSISKLGKFFGSSEKRRADSDDKKYRKGTKKRFSPAV